MQATIPRWSGQGGREFVDSLLGFMRSAGAGRYDDVVSQLDHALQTAALAVRDGDSDHAVAAALMHDIGHMLLTYHDDPAVLGADLGHETVGADWLSHRFPDTVTGPIRGHVLAKRYLCAIDADYHARLSPASQRSLMTQGGALPAAERASVDRIPHFAAAVTLRRRDDAAKVVGRVVPGLESYRALLESLVRAREGG